MLVVKRGRFGSDRLIPLFFSSSARMRLDNLFFQQREVIRNRIATWLLNWVSRVVSGCGECRLLVEEK